MLRQMDQAPSIVRQESGHVQGMVSVGLSYSTLSVLGMPLIEAIRERYPHLLLNVVEGMSGHLCQMLRRRQLDLAVLFSSEFMAADFSAVTVLDEELFLMLPEASDLVEPHRTEITLEEAARLPLVLPTNAHGLRRRISAELERRSLPANVVAEIDSVSLLLQCVQSGMGATIEPLSAIQGDRRTAGAWRTLAFSDVALQRRSYLYAAESDFESAAISAVALELRSTATRLGNCLSSWPCRWKTWTCSRCRVLACRQ